MIITIFGSTGTVGKELVRQALFKGHTVKAFGRNVYTSGFREDPSLELIPGAVFDDEDLKRALAGSDAVLSALGGATDGNDRTRSLGMKHIVAQMEKSTVRRLIAVGGMGSLNTEDGKLIMDNPGFPAIFLPVSKEHYKAYECLKSSNLDWTFVCPPDIIPAGPTGLFKVAVDHPPDAGTNKINVGDLAMFMVNELSQNEYIHQKVGISNSRS